MCHLLSYCLNNVMYKEMRSRETYKSVSLSSTQYKLYIFANLDHKTFSMRNFFKVLHISDITLI